MLFLIISFLFGLIFCFILIKLFKKDNSLNFIELKVKFDEIIKQNSEKEQKIIELTKEVNDGSQNFGRLSAEKISLIDQINDMKIKILKMDEISQNNNNLIVKNDSFERENIRIIDENIELKKNIKLQQNELDTFNEKNLKLIVLDSAYKEQLEFNKIQMEKLNQEIVLLKENIEGKNNKIDELMKENREYNAKIEGLTTINKGQDENIKTIEEVKKQMINHFQNISNEVIKGQRENFDKEQKISLENLLNPLKDQMDVVKKQMTDVNEKNVETKTSIETTIKNLIETTNNIGSKADNLAKALKGDKKSQGNWGELTLNNLLESAGLEKNLDFITQQSSRNDENERLIPDFVINLPENKKLIIDSKVSLINYQNYIEAEENEKNKYLVSYCKDIEQHIKELGDKKYQDLYKNTSLDFVFMFLPLESAYLEAIKYKKELFDIAFKNKVAIVTSSSLMPVLRMITHLWNIEKQNRNIEEIVKKVVNLYDKFARFIEQFKDIENKLNGAKKSYDEAYKYLTTGSANVVKTVDEIKNMIGKDKVKENINIDFEDTNNN